MFGFLSVPVALLLVLVVVRAESLLFFCIVFFFVVTSRLNAPVLIELCTPLVVYGFGRVSVCSGSDVFVREYNVSLMSPAAQILK